MGCTLRDRSVAMILNLNAANSTNAAVVRCHTLAAIISSVPLRRLGSRTSMTFELYEEKDLKARKTSVLLALALLGFAAACTPDPEPPQTLVAPSEEATTAGPASSDAFLGTVGGYEGWWNATPPTDRALEHPHVVLVDTSTGEVVDVYNREGDPDWSPVPPSADWPNNAVVVLDAQTHDVVHTINVDDNGVPVGSDG